jgi:hypothetical protein
VKLPAAARQLKVGFTTVRLLVTNGDLERDPESDTSGARFVTRASVHACWLARSNTKRRKVQPAATVPFTEVVRFTGLGRRAVVDLIRAGVLEEVAGRRATCEITTASLGKWLSDRDRACPPAEAGRRAGATGRAP